MHNFLLSVSAIECYTERFGVYRLHKVDHE